MTDVDTMARLWNEDGLSAGAIAAKLGVSRNTVAGTINRNRDKFEVRRKPPQYKRFGGVSPKERAKRGPAQASPRGNAVANIHRARMEASQRVVAEFQAGTSPLLQTAPSDLERLSTAKPLLDLEQHECRWPVNNGSPFLFCADATDGKTYCVHHARRAFSARAV